MLTIVGIVAIVVMTIQAYKTAASTERNAAGWAVITVVIGIGLQFVVPILIGIALGIYYVSTGVPVEDIQNRMLGPAVIISIVGIVLSIIGMGLVMKFVSRVKDDDPAVAPPPPPTFGANQ